MIEGVGPVNSTMGEVFPMDATWSDLETRGFVVVRGFFSEADLGVLRTDFAATPNLMPNGNYNIRYAARSIFARFEPQLKAASDRVRSATGIDADITSSALYFSIGNGIDFGWHQDHESFFVFQDHYNYLNFYIPIVKENLKDSNLCLIPFDQIKLYAAEYYLSLIGGGATRFVPHKNVTLVFYDETNTWDTLPFDIEKLAVTPELDAGDLLLLRGDMIHRTQDTSTERVAISFRRHRAKSLVKKERLDAGGRKKREMIKNNSKLYSAVTRCFSRMNKNEMPAEELVAGLALELRG